MKKIGFFLPLFILLLWSCAKPKEKKIIGSWEYQYFTHYDDGRSITWVFADDGILTQYTKVDNPDTVTASYKIDAKYDNTYYLTIDGINVDNDGKYRILTLNKKFLIMQRVEHNGQTKNVFARKEFVKK